MPSAINLSPYEMTTVLDCVNALQKCNHRERGKTVKFYLTDRLGWGRDKSYRILKANGRNTERKQRSDAGSTSVDETNLVKLGAMLALGQRKNGKETMKVTTARSIMAASGIKMGVGNDQLCRLLRNRKLDMKTTKKEEAYQDMRSKHPNQVHGTDPSLCLLYYTPKGQQKVLHDDEIYKNKPQWVEKIGNLKCWRYVLTDHYSSTILVKYYASAGETVENMYDFLLWCWTKNTQQKVFHGIPRLLVWDKGSANQAHAIKNALKSLQITDWSHMAGNPKAKGFVEKSNDMVETQFESRLTYEPVKSVDELNERAQEWQHAYNANLLPEYDSRLSRNGIKIGTRTNIWQRINAEQLRLLPDFDICRYLLIKDAVNSKILRNLTIRYSHPKAKQPMVYDVSDLPNITVGSRLNIRPLVYKDLAILVEYKGLDGIETFEIMPTEIDEVGFATTATVWGEEFKQPKKDTTQKSRDKMKKALYPNQNEEQRIKAFKNKDIPFDGQMNSLSHLKDIESPAFLTQKGEQITVKNPIKTKQKDKLNQPAKAHEEVPKLTKIQAMKLMTKMGVEVATKNKIYTEITTDGIAEKDLLARVSPPGVLQFKRRQA